MPARPLSNETLHLIDAVRTALAQRSDVEERAMFGGYCFLVDSKICVAVRGNELLVRLPPSRHAEFQEMQNTREMSPRGGMLGYFWVEPNGYATREQWQFWLTEALAYNPLAKASPRKKARTSAATQRAPAATGSKKPASKAAAKKKKHSIFEADD
ncbi:TfoX/Sxy family protein [Acidovorax sp.]|uniref:TfoX/Sxy family protein n=1 Tax=Acidovorax sp. TaxID=1872122 RepID=UPI00261A4753|nr:TfoX/Sxy family protein [Acidovorax sp.]